MTAKKSADKKKFFFTSTVYTLPLIFLLLTIIVALFLHPGIRPRWDKKYRANLFNNFLEQILHDKKVDAQKFWVFRERFSPGYFELNQAVTDFKQTFTISTLDDSQTTPLLFYHSPFLNSVDSISKDASPLLEIKENYQGQIIFDEENLFITEIEMGKDRLKKYNIYFILPIEEMKKANGLFDYTSDEIQLLEDKFWLNNSEIIIYL